MSRPVRTWPQPGASSADVVADLHVLDDAMTGRGPAVATPGTLLAPGTTVPDEAALVVATSGTTGPPKPALLTADAIRCAVREVQDALGGPGQWLLALPPAHISGLQVLLRNLAGGHHSPSVAPGHFSPAAFVAAARGLSPAAPRRYVTLVPTQLRRLLDDADALACARDFDRVLVGAAPLPPADRARAERLGLRIVDGYGCSETAGGCVYDGRPLPSTRLRLDADGRIHLGGAQVALGYLPMPGSVHMSASAFTTDAAGTRWFRTDDHGTIERNTLDDGTLDAGRLRVVGRLDDVVTTGGLKVAPAVVEDAIRAAGCGVAQVLVVGLPDPEWGEAVAALVVPEPGARPTLAGVRAALADRLPAHALPKVVCCVADLPVRGAGKPDRVSARRMLMAADQPAHLGSRLSGR